MAAKARFPGVVSVEPGGACWDYESCSGAGGIRGAANPHGIPDDHMDRYQYLNLLQRPSRTPRKVHRRMCTTPVRGVALAGWDAPPKTYTAPS
jgi:hypothetical protein